MKQNGCFIRIKSGGGYYTMKKVIILLVSIFLLTGCNVLEEVNHSANYLTEATNYIQNITEFGEQIPQYVENSISELEIQNQLRSMKADIEHFIQIDPPVIAKDIHEQLVTSGEELLNSINKAINSGQVVIENISNTQVYETISNITNLMNAIENLGL